VLAFVPQRAQAELLKQKPELGGPNPGAITEAIRRIAGKYGIGFVDMGQSFGQISNPGDLYFAVDGHLKPRGQEMLGHAVASTLLRDGGPAFSGCQESLSTLTRN